MNRVKMSIRMRKEALFAYACITPLICGLLFLVILPIILVVVVSLMKWSAIGTPRFIGLTNYIRMFNDGFIYKSLRVTIYYATGSIISSLTYALLLALFLNMKVPGRTVFRSIFFLPYVIPSVASALIWMWVFNVDFGLLNYGFGLIGLPKSLWVFGEKTAVPSMFIMSMWVSGNYIIIFLAGLQDVPRSLLEAVEIDGGNAWHKFRSVTLPMISPVVFYNFLMGMISNLQNFNSAYIMTSGGPNDATLFTVFYLVREAFKRSNFGYACSIAVVFFALIVILTAFVFKIANRFVYYEGR